MIREITVLGSHLNGVEIVPQSTVSEILQNVRCILSTLRGTLPLDRSFGTNSEIVDKMQPAARQLLEADIITTLQKYEPRVTITGISWEKADAAADGALCPKVLLTIKEGVI